MRSGGSVRRAEGGEQKPATFPELVEGRAGRARAAGLRSGCGSARPSTGSGNVLGTASGAVPAARIAPNARASSSPATFPARRRARRSATVVQGSHPACASPRALRQAQGTFCDRARVRFHAPELRTTARASSSPATFPELVEGRGGRDGASELDPARFARPSTSSGNVLATSPRGRVRAPFDRFRALALRRTTRHTDHPEPRREEQTRERDEHHGAERRGLRPARARSG